MFRDFLIFEIDKDRDNKSWWRTPDGTFLDLPYLETGLKEYYEILDSTSKKRKWALSPRYQELGLDAQRLGKFAQAVGAKVQLRVTEQEIPLNHPEWKTHFQHTAAQRITSTSINSDYSIPEFKDLLENPTIGRSKLIWRTMYIQKDRVLKARFRPNQNHETCKANSSLVHVLKEKAWVPQRYEDSISFTLPCDATSRYLPEGFKYVSSWAWLKAIKFDTTTSARKSENSQLRQHAKKMGFDSVDEAETMAGIVKDLKAQGKSTADLEDLVGQMHHDRQRRQRLIIDDLIHAGEKQYEVRARSINTSRDSIDPKTYLRARYTTRMNDVECQMCEERMPFKKRNSDEDYFEAVEALNKIYFPKEHEAQYLALCPECAAKFKEYVKRNTRENAQEHLNRKLKESKGPKVSLDLRDFIIDIQFAEKHLEDLKTVLYYYENIYEGEN